MAERRHQHIIVGIRPLLPPMRRLQPAHASGALAVATLALGRLRAGSGRRQAASCGVVGVATASWRGGVAAAVLGVGTGVGALSSPESSRRSQ